MKTKRFELWKWYDRKDGKRIQVIEVKNNGWFDGVRCSDYADCDARHVPDVEFDLEFPKSSSATSGWRYNREGDRGRVTGSAHDFSDPFNLIPELDPDVDT